MLVPIIKECKILDGYSIGNLEYQINSYIKQGWQPSGDIFYTPNSSTAYQKMVLYDTDPYFETIK